MTGAPTERRRSTAHGRAAAAAWPALVVAALLVAASAGVAAATVRVSAERQGDSIEIEASAVLDADAGVAWRVLTDYDRYAEFIPDLRTSRVVARSGPFVTVEQSGEAHLWLFRMPLNLTFVITESPPFQVRSRVVAGSMHRLESRYEIVPMARGIGLHYAGSVAPGFVLFGSVEQYAIRQNVARQFQALADEIERASAAAQKSAMAAGRRGAR